MHDDPDADWYLDHVLYYAEPGGGRVVLGPAAQWDTWWRIAARELVGDRPELALAARQGFALTSAQLVELGVSRKQARTLVRRGTWSAPFPGTVTVLDPRVEFANEAPDPWVVRRRRHALDCAAAALRNPGFMVSSRSAAVLRGLPTVGLPSRPVLTAPVLLHAHRRRKATVTSEAIEHWHGVPVFSVARTIVDMARQDRREGIVVADAALREELVHAPVLAVALGRARGWSGVRAAREIVALADGRAESPLESITRLALHDDGFPAPQLQVEFTVPGRRAPYRVDMYWPQLRVILECDGRVKYPDDDKGRRWHEKQRDVALGRLVDSVEHVVWSDVTTDWPLTREYLRGVLRPCAAC